MSDEYQVRKDIDRLISDVYDVSDNSLNLVPFKDGSPLKGVKVNPDGSDMGTIDAILESYGLFDIEQRVIELEQRVIELEKEVQNANQ